MKIIGIIPARYKSSRYPGKPLVPLLGKPMIIHVAERVAQALGRENVVVATDDTRIQEVAEAHGFTVVLTRDDHPTGTDRLWEVSTKLPADIYINIQGDEPMVNPADILQVAAVKQLYPGHIINGMCPLLPGEDPGNINIPKVVVNRYNDLVYMSRLAVPGVKSPCQQPPLYLKQVCIYAFTAQELAAFGEQGTKAVFEAFEDIEILRFLDMGMPVKMVMTSGNTLAVDVPEDVAKVEAALQQLN